MEIREQDSTRSVPSEVEKTAEDEHITTCTARYTDMTTSVSDDDSDYEEMHNFVEGNSSDFTLPTGKEAEEDTPVVSRNTTPTGERSGDTEDTLVCLQGAAEALHLSIPTTTRADLPSSLPLSGSRPMKKVLLAPALSLSLGRSDSTMSDDFPAAFLSPTADEDDTELDLDLDAMETPSDNESFPFSLYDLNIEAEMRRLGVASCQPRAHGSGPGPRSGPGAEAAGAADHAAQAFLGQEDTVDSNGTRWRCVSVGEPPQESRVNMSVLEPYLRVLSHGGYYGDGMNDIIVFSSCYLPENNLKDYQYVMDNLFRYVVGTLELMVSENYVIIYLCAGGQRNRLPGIGWLRECYTTIDRRLRKNLKGLYVVHPMWYIKALVTIIKPFISSKFSKKLQFISSLLELSQQIPTENVQFPNCVTQFDQSIGR